MKKNILVLLAIILLFGSSAIGQDSPGYMGKKFLFGYRFSMMPGFGKPPSNNAEYTRADDGENRSSGNFKLNYYHEGFMEVVIGRKTTLIINARFSSGQFSPHIYNLTGYWEGSSLNDWAQYHSVSGITGIRWYRKHLAPLSSYLGVNVGVSNVQTDRYDYIDFSEGRKTAISESGYTMLIGLELGANKILYDRLVVNFSLQSTFLTSAIFNFLYGGLYYEGDSNYDNLLPEAYFRMQQQQILNFGIGVGFLP